MLRAAADGIDQRACDVESLIRVEAGRIHEVSVFRGAKGRMGPFRIARVTFTHILQNARLYTVSALSPQLFKAAFGPDFKARGDEKLDRRIGANHRSDVASVDHGAWCAARRMGGKIPLKRKQCRPDLRMHRYLGCGDRDVIGQEGRIIEIGGAHKAGRTGCVGRIGGVAADFPQVAGRRPVQPPGIEPRVAVMGREAGRPCPCPTRPGRRWR